VATYPLALARCPRMADRGGENQQKKKEHLLELILVRPNMIWCLLSIKMKKIFHGKIPLTVNKVYEEPQWVSELLNVIIL
jgi:hypothetical protein